MPSPQDTSPRNEFIREFTSQTRTIRDMAATVEALASFEKSRVRKMYEFFFITVLILLLVGFFLGLLFIYSHKQLATDDSSLVNVSSEIGQSLQQLSAFLTVELKENRDKSLALEEKTSVLEVEIKQLKNEKVELEERLTMLNDDNMKMRESAAYLEKYVMENTRSGLPDEVAARIGAMENELRSLRAKVQSLEKAAPPPSPAPVQ